jgi:phage baseplate assembly protein gpV
MYDVIVGMKADLEMLKTAFGNALKVGPVEVIDAEKGYRLKLGEGPDGPFLSPWYPHPESGGATSTWMPLSKGQIVGVMNPNGDPRQGVMFRGGFSEGNPAPSQDLSANVLRAFGLTLTITDGKLVIEGDVLVRGNVDFSDGHVRHNGTPIDDTHVHGGVERGGSVTSGPVGG